MTVTVFLDWRDAYTGGCSILLLLSFWLAFRARNIAKDDDRRSQWFMLWSGLLLLVGHGVLLVVTAILSVEGLWPANVGFMLFGARASIGMALGLRKTRKRAPDVTPTPSVPAPPVDHAPPPPELVPPRNVNGHQLPAQRLAPTGSGPRPRSQFGPNSAALVAEPTKTDVLAPPQDRLKDTQ